MQKYSPVMDKASEYDQDTPEDFSISVSGISKLFFLKATEYEQEITQSHTAG